MKVRNILLLAMLGVSTTTLAEEVGVGFDGTSGMTVTSCETSCTTTQDTTITTETEASLWQQLLELLGTDTVDQ